MNELGHAPLGQVTGLPAARWRSKGTLAFDFDGVLHQHPKYHWPLGATDFDVMREAMARGYSVAVVTANVVSMVGDVLAKQGFTVLVDKDMNRARWAQQGTVLVTNRKIPALAYVDDRAIRWTYGQDPAVIWDIVEATHYVPSTSTKHRPGWRPFRRPWRQR